MLCLLVGCSTGVDGLQTFEIDDQVFTVGDAIRVAPGSVALMNVDDDTCDAFLSDAPPTTFADQDPLLIGAFAEGPFGVASVAGDDPRMYVTSHAVDDHIELFDTPELGRLELRLTFDRVLRRVEKGERVYVDVEELEPPVVIEGAIAVRPCATGY